ncbi:hypothetical protein E3O19_15745 [Cryobacterium algoritolerans]|uniref:Polyphosphate kinase-2-related domain-containing protein n=1 Tax=Cryobacterium algoritolerans TaxID=1259184 RepID=A0A4V3IE24_9MICO|nr:hypothetical protein [Cryobacterium algoritolerans]TFC10448.1 hypothetical protein E3O19_15745 [Cryobacterium algoritolerans]
MPKTVWSEAPSEIHRVDTGFQLKVVDPAAIPGIDASKGTGTAILLNQSRMLDESQGKLFADSTVGGTGSLVIVLQGIDTSGKGEIVTHVLAGMSPSGIIVHRFTAPTAKGQAPRHVIPADHKWYARLAVQQIVLMKLREVKLDWPRPNYGLKKELRRVVGA